MKLPEIKTFCRRFKSFYFKCAAALTWNQTTLESGWDWWRGGHFVHVNGSGFLLSDHFGSSWFFQCFKCVVRIRVGIKEPWVCFTGITGGGLTPVPKRFHLPEVSLSAAPTGGKEPTANPGKTRKPVYRRQRLRWTLTDGFPNPPGRRGNAHHFRLARFRFKQFEFLTVKFVNNEFRTMEPVWRKNVRNRPRGREEHMNQEESIHAGLGPEQQQTENSRVCSFSSV